MVDAHHLIYTVFEVRMRFCDFPTGSEFYQWQEIRVISINLIGRGEDKYCLRAMQPRHFEHIQGSASIDTEIGEWFFRRPVVAWLCCSVQYQFYISPIFFE